MQAVAEHGRRARRSLTSSCVTEASNTSASLAIPAKSRRRCWSESLALHEYANYIENSFCARTLGGYVTGCLV